MKRVICGLAACAALFPAASAGAQNVTADAQRIAAVLQEAGYRAEIDGEAPFRYVMSGSSGLDFTIQLFGCNDAGDDCKTAMFVAWFEDSTPPSFEDLNHYNARRRWGRAFIDHEGDPTIEMDLDLEDGGVSPELFIDNVEYWDLALREFDLFLASGVVPTD